MTIDPIGDLLRGGRCIVANVTDLLTQCGWLEQQKGTVVKRAKASPPDVPSGYPRDLEAHLTLADGREVFVRPIVPSDIDELRDAIASADAQTLHDRFLGGRPPEDEETLRHLTTLDYVHRLAVVAFAPDGHGVGIARYEGKAGSDLAEVAVVVDPAWRRVGLATNLLRVLGMAALDRGIRSFTATTYAENIDVTDLLARSGLPHIQTGSGAVVDHVVVLSEPPPGTAQTAG